MKLRNGKTYYFSLEKPKKKEICKKKINHTNFCCICCEKYRIGDYITSCRKHNLDKHSYHTTCILELKVTYLKLNKILECPYCRIKLEKTDWKSITQV